MAGAAHQLVTRFFADLGAGTLADEMFTEDATAWTLSTKAEGPAALYRHGTKVLASLFPAGIAYTIGSITAEGDRAAAETTGHGVLYDGKVYDNHYVMLFRIRDGKIAALAEYFDPRPVEELIMPLLTAAMAAQKG
ncbi:MAG: nuclear transport factor 2 family protein [Novosphingobium sp.]|jgi:ketosteroid isomerase-like protein|nr:nuclear transport factor 2 family protein [Novosphingobium sp.]